MKSKSKAVCIRFNLSNPMHIKAMNYLYGIDKKKYKTYTDAVVIALVEHFEKEQKMQDDPYFETREKENAFAERIIEAVTTELKHTIPTLSLLPLQYNTDTIPPPEIEKEIDEEYVDWDFLG